MYITSHFPCLAQLPQNGVRVNCWGCWRFKLVLWTKTYYININFHVCFFVCLSRNPPNNIQQCCAYFKDIGPSNSIVVGCHGLLNLNAPLFFVIDTCKCSYIWYIGNWYDIMA